MRQSLGTAVFAGMLGVTLFGLVFTPVFYVLVRKVGLLLTRREAPVEGGCSRRGDEGCRLRGARRPLPLTPSRKGRGGLGDADYDWP